MEGVRQAAQARSDLKAMVRGQVLSRGVRDRRVLGALLRVDRGIFVPAAARPLAYEDHPVTLGHGQTISQPFMVALMLDALQVRRGMKVLEIGSGSGYVLALLLAMGARPLGFEWYDELAEAIPGRLRQAGLSPCQVRRGDGAAGWHEEAPFDRILVSAACPVVPPPLLRQLAAGGILVAPVDVPGGRAQVLERITLTASGPRRERTGGCVFVRLLGAYGNAGMPG